MKILRIIEISLASAALLGLALKAYGIEKGGLFVYLSLMILGLLYLFSNVFLYEKNKRKTGLAIVSEIAFAFGVSSIMFKAQLIPNQPDTLLKTSIVFLAIIVAYIMYRLSKDKEYKDFYKKNQIRAVVIALIGFAFYMIPARTLAHVYFRHDPTLEELEIKAFEHPDEEKYHKELYDYKMKKE
ncbi:MAG: hypothetical protein WD048_06620 [Chitinophagales bacterium]